ncbi:MAG: signal peptidase I [Lachnospiraceae bacterium]|nr:signal peptidase I [Lachnospiraceae bacterium]
MVSQKRKKVRQKPPNTDHKRQATTNQKQKTNRKRSTTNRKAQPQKRSGGFLFYISLVVILVSVFFLTRGNDAGIPRHLMGFSVMRILTTSMQSELPQHSLIITRQVDPAEIQIGDDLTFMVDENTTFTHRVILIYENYLESGQRGFQTQGVENARPDSSIVRPENIIGRVVWHSFLIGRTMYFIREHVLLIGIFAALLIAFITTVKLAQKLKHDEMPMRNRRPAKRKETNHRKPMRSRKPTKSKETNPKKPNHGRPMHNKTSMNKRKPNHKKSIKHDTPR